MDIDEEGLHDHREVVAFKFSAILDVHHRLLIAAHRRRRIGDALRGASVCCAATVKWHCGYY